MILKNQLKLDNLKLHGIPEGSEETRELRIFISTWLAALMQLEDGVVPILTIAYCLGAQSAQRYSNPLP